MPNYYCKCVIDEWMDGLESIADGQLFVLKKKQQVAQKHCKNINYH